MHKVTPTCACIQPINSPDKEKIFVSLQRLSRCNSVALGDVKPWLGHGQTRKRRQVRARPESIEEESLGRSNSKSNETNSSDGHVDPVTRGGRTVRKPARYRLNLCSCPEGSAPQQGGSCKTPAGGHVGWRAARERRRALECEHEWDSTERHQQ